MHTICYALLVVSESLVAQTGSYETLYMWYVASSSRLLLEQLSRIMMAQSANPTRGLRQERARGRRRVPTQPDSPTTPRAATWEFAFWLSMCLTSSALLLGSSTGACRTPCCGAAGLRAYPP